MLKVQAMQYARKEDDFLWSATINKPMYKMDYEDGTFKLDAVPGGARFPMPSTSHGTDPSGIMVLSGVGACLW